MTDLGRTLWSMTRRYPEMALMVGFIIASLIGGAIRMAEL